MRTAVSPLIEKRVEKNNRIHHRFELSIEDKEFELFRELIYRECGICLSENKKVMVVGRLGKRLRMLNMTRFEDYYRYITGSKNGKEELSHMINAITTNKTDFFREDAHFSILKDQVLPEIITSKRFQARKKLSVWSAGCSTGEEPYTLGMVLADFFKEDFNRFHILASDICTEVIDRAKKGIYSKDRIAPVPVQYRHRYLMHGVGEWKGHYRVVPELRKNVSFQRVNLISNDFGFRQKMDIIFCRNVVIYFDVETRVNLFHRLFDALTSGGFLFIGHSETLNGINTDFQHVLPGVYQKPSLSGGGPWLKK